MPRVLQRPACWREWRRRERQTGAGFRARALHTPNAACSALLRGRWLAAGAGPNSRRVQSLSGQLRRRPTTEAGVSLCNVGRSAALRSGELHGSMVDSGGCMRPLTHGRKVPRTTLNDVRHRRRASRRGETVCPNCIHVYVCKRCAVYFIVMYAPYTAGLLLYKKAYMSHAWSESSEYAI